MDPVPDPLLLRKSRIRKSVEKTLYTYLAGPLGAPYGTPVEKH